MGIEDIPAESASGLCAICDNAVEDWQEWAVVSAHGGKYLCHYDCAYSDDEDE